MKALAILSAKSMLCIANFYTPYISTVFAGKDMVKEWVRMAKKKSATVHMKSWAQRVF